MNIYSSIATAYDIGILVFVCRLEERRSTNMEETRIEDECRTKCFITVGELALLMRISKSLAYKYVESDGCPFNRIFVGNRITIPTKTFFEWYDGLQNEKS